MKQNNRYVVLGWLTALLLASGCSEKSAWNFTDEQEENDSLFTITLTTESVGAQSRATAESQISDGTKVDMLLYAVYDENGNLLQDFQNLEDIDDALKAKAGTGQSVKDITNFPVTLSINLDRKKSYKLAFWAQNKDCNAFTTGDLKNVSVDYTKIKNNDELSDAFCATLTIAKGAMSAEVMLKRPFAQINVGTTGADFKNIVNGRNTYPTTRYAYSQITITGVSNTIDVLNDKVGEATSTVTLAWNKMAAWWNTEIIPSDVTEFIGDDDNKIGEEFLLVDLDQDGKVHRYKTYYPTLKYDGSYLTETFKYLSMCYVLVPYTTDDTGNETSAILDKVTIEMSANENGEPSISKEVSSVPVHRNWRTNILGGLRYMKDPDGVDPDDPKFPDPDNPNNPDPDPDYPYPTPDPDNPNPPTPPTPPTPDPENPDPEIPVGPDPGSMFNTVSVIVTINQDFFGQKFQQNNKWKDDDEFTSQNKSAK